MKNLSKRNKMILAIAGVLVVVAIVVGVGMTQLSGGELFGAASNLVITPSNPGILVDETKGLSVNAVYNCAWTSSDTAKVSLVNYTGETKSVTVKGNAVGSATITAKCGLGTINVNQVTTVVTVNNLTISMPTSNYNLVVGESRVLSSNASNTCTWSGSNNGVSFVGATTGQSVTIKGAVGNQSTTISAQCGNSGTGSIVLRVQPFAFSSNPRPMSTGTTLSVSTPSGENCTWTDSMVGNSYPVQFWVNNRSTYLSQTGTSVELYASSTGTGTITVSCPEGRSATLTVNVTPPGTKPWGY